VKVYILKENFYNYDSGEEPTSIVDVFSTREKAVEERKKVIQDNILDFDFIIDTDLLKQYTKEEVLNCDFITLFYSFQKNWQNYIELEIEEKEVL